MRRRRNVSKNLRLKSFQPEEEYVYLTYSLKKGGEQDITGEL